MTGDDYGGLQQPSGGYADEKESADGYGPAKNPSMSYATQPQASASPTAGFGDGVNLQPSYYPLNSNPQGDVDLGWDLMRQNGKIKSVRIEIEPDQTQNAQRWIKEAWSIGYDVIATYHIATSRMKNTEQELLEAANWWMNNYKTLAGSAPVTVNLMNEWGDGKIMPRDFADIYNQAIAIVRSTYGGPIIIDAPGSGQATRTAALAITDTKTVTIKDRNVILSVHLYPDAWNPSTGKGLTRGDLDELETAAVACMVGEFGENGKPPATNWVDLVDYAKSKGWPVFGWAWNGDGGSMNMITPQFQARGGTLQPYTKAPYYNTIDARL